MMKKERQRSDTSTRPRSNTEHCLAAVKSGVRVQKVRERDLFGGRDDEDNEPDFLAGATEDGWVT